MSVDSTGIYSTGIHSTGRAGTLRSADELRALAESGAAELGEAGFEQVVSWVAANFAVDAVAVACSMADAVLPHVVSAQLPDVDVLFLDTGYHFSETHETRADVARLLPVRVVDVLPEHSVAEQDGLHGAELFNRDPNLCCAMRKVEPLHRALGGYELWFTGVRRDEAPTRANTPLVTWDERNGLVKVNPLAAWSFEDILDYAAAHQVPVNPLMAQGYPSIGCAPCTKPVAPGDDPRSGRWASLAKTECGLHL
ncbi:phosphoadenylyl-sulfate reductase [Cryobacterium mannosilyticum]|uniref:Adenosine 5'-phosphosulfate reductase n=1 Tax=Cryobacterium mannosilyticum TaxID=1259190 RepID=A0A4R8WAG8_9MICO|nr:phosphoadenylyl-sulfate reductase [Cryobacterium mannosilyticum]TFC05018.1 phosphoadenylyl-sulfate reductase [Cryobacterium mannosilyticum]